MVKASSAAANQFDQHAEHQHRADRERRAERRAPRPAGRGPPGSAGCAVRVITASMSASYHMLSAPEAPAPIAMHSSAVNPITGCTCPGATIRPTSAVNTTSDITRGFSSAI